MPRGGVRPAAPSRPAQHRHERVEIVEQHLAVLNIPSRLSPELFVCLGYPAAVQPPGMRARGRITWQSLTDWERFPTGDACPFNQ